MRKQITIHMKTAKGRTEPMMREEVQEGVTAVLTD